MRTLILFFIFLSIGIHAQSQASFALKYDFGSQALLNNMHVVDDTIYIKGLISDKETGQPCILYARIDSSGMLIDHHQYCDSLGRVYTSNKNYPFIACSDGGFLIEDDIYGSGGNTGLYKLSKEGAVEFYTEYEGSENFRTILPRRLVEIEDGYLVMHRVQMPDYSGRLQLIKLNKRGEIQWERRYDRGGSSGAFDLVKVDENTILVVGAVKGYWFFTIDSLGNKQWEKVIGGWDDGAMELILEKARNGGWMYLALPMTVFVNDPLSYGFAPTVGKFTGDMEKEWEDVVAESYWPTNDQFYTLKETPDRNWTVAGRMEVPFPSDITAENQEDYETHLCFYKFSSAGDSIWLHCYTPFEEEDLFYNPSWVAHDVLSSGALVAAGYFYKNGQYHPVLVKVDKNGCLDTPCLPTSTEVPSVKNNLRVYPNPARDKITFQLPDTASSATYNLLITDMLGRTIVHKEILIKSGEFIWYREGQKGGLYFYKVTDKTGVVGQGKLFIE